MPVESSGSQTQRATLITLGWRAGQILPTSPRRLSNLNPPGGFLRTRNHISNSLERQPESSASRLESRVVGVSRPTRVHGQLVSWPSCSPSHPRPAYLS
ncbi:hypothetical protein NDU88_008077 [Pleurodeles waltl]|uniref:Uncharacterized protein n=1 Tax=Pleurodeles waltl TaxID=8319 RepID=A0AAV7QMP3_PLEWA|nr:hypothetical protein NDU88_008077 [Pleurodeles waltl]